MYFTASHVTFSAPVIHTQERTIYSESPLTCMFFLGSPVLMSELWPTVICTRSVARTCWRCCFNFQLSIPTSMLQSWLLCNHITKRFSSQRWVLVFVSAGSGYVPWILWYILVQFGDYVQSQWCMFTCVALIKKKTTHTSMTINP